MLRSLVRLAELAVAVVVVRWRLELLLGRRLVVEMDWLLALWPGSGQPATKRSSNL